MRCTGRYSPEQQAPTLQGAEVLLKLGSHTASIVSIIDIHRCLQSSESTGAGFQTSLQYFSAESLSTIEPKTQKLQTSSSKPTFAQMPCRHFLLQTYDCSMYRSISSRDLSASHSPNVVFQRAGSTANISKLRGKRCTIDCSLQNFFYFCWPSFCKSTHIRS